LKGELSLEDVRDNIRLQLHDLDPTAFPMGQMGASVGRLAAEMLRTNNIVTASQHVCTNCDFEGPEEDGTLGYLLCPSQSQSPSSTSELVNNLGYNAHQSCPECMCDMITSCFYTTMPSVLIVEYPESNTQTSHIIEYNTDAGTVFFYLRGIVYHGGFHFASRILSSGGVVWYHDGREAGGSCQPNGTLSTITEQGIRRCKNRNLVLAVYTLS